MKGVLAIRLNTSMPQKGSTTSLVLVTLSTLVTLIPFSNANLGGCDNSYSFIFNCTGAELTTIPNYQHVPSYYQTLDFSNNYISNISRLNFSSYNVISTILLRNNRISHIQSSAFEVMTHLVTLDLSGNVLNGYSIDEKQFYDLKKLKLLNLERNPLQFIGKDTFNFIELPVIKHLDLSHCDISEIEDGAIVLPGLEYLDLSWNKLEAFHKESFKMLIELKTLDLSHNQITVLDEVPYLPEIRIWKLDNNKINNVTIRDYVLNLADSLEYMYIRNNDIVRFTPQSFPWDLESLKGIYLDNNHIQCDCQLRWVVKDVDILHGNFTIPCEYPSKHRGKNLLSIPPDELRCGTPVYKVLVIIALSVVVVLCFALLVFFIVKRKKSKQKAGGPTQVKRIGGANWTIFVLQHTKDQDDVKVSISDEKVLLTDSREFDV